MLAGRANHQSLYTEAFRGISPLIESTFVVCRGLSLLYRLVPLAAQEAKRTILPEVAAGRYKILHRVRTYEIATTTYNCSETSPGVPTVEIGISSPLSVQKLTRYVTGMANSTTTISIARVLEVFLHIHVQGLHL